MDEFYLPEEIIEWIGQKKSEYLSKIIENMEADDFKFEEHLQFDELIPATLALPDWSIETKEDGQKVKVFCRAYADPEVFQQVVVGTLVPDQNKSEVLIPIITFVSRKEGLVKLFSGGKSLHPILN